MDREEKKALLRLLAEKEELYNQLLTNLKYQQKALSEENYPRLNELQQKWLDIGDKGDRVDKQINSTMNYQADQSIRGLLERLSHKLKEIVILNNQLKDEFSIRQRELKKELGQLGVVQQTIHGYKKSTSPIATFIDRTY